LRHVRCRTGRTRLPRAYKSGGTARSYYEFDQPDARVRNHKTPMFTKAPLWHPDFQRQAPSVPKLQLVQVKELFRQPCISSPRIRYCIELLQYPTKAYRFVFSLATVGLLPVMLGSATSLDVSNSSYSFVRSMPR
jgi:hypothetical protein